MYLLHFFSIGPLVRKPVNANPGSKVMLRFLFRVFKANFKSPIESNQSQIVGQKRFTEVLIAWLI